MEEYPSKSSHREKYKENTEDHRVELSVDWDLWFSVSSPCALCETDSFASKQFPKQALYTNVHSLKLQHSQLFRENLWHL